MTAKIEELIDKADVFELVRDEIGAILLVESTKQQELATAAAKDPSLWKLRVFSERALPWAEWIDAPQSESGPDATPIINVWYERDTVNESASSSVSHQKVTATYNVDCYGYGVSAEGSGAHKPGDESAALEAHRAVRLVRNILMAGAYTYLGIRGIVSGRRHQSRTVFQPQIDNRAVQRIVAVRLALEVDFIETSPQVKPVDLEILSVKVERADNGELIFRSTYDFTEDSI